MSGRILIVALVAAALAGCSFERHYLPSGGKNQVVRVESGDRLFMDLEENATTGYRWEATSDDADVEVEIVHVPGKSDEGLAGAPGKAEVTIRVHRGYDGPTAVTFRYKRPWEKEPLKKFTVTLFKRTGDCAFWK